MKKNSSDVTDKIFQTQWFVGLLVFFQFLQQLNFVFVCIDEPGVVILFYFSYFELVKGRITTRKTIRKAYVTRVILLQSYVIPQFLQRWKILPVFVFFVILIFRCMSFVCWEDIVCSNFVIFYRHYSLERQSRLGRYGNLAHINTFLIICYYTWPTFFPNFCSLCSPWMRLCT